MHCKLGRFALGVVTVCGLIAPVCAAELVPREKLDPVASSVIDSGWVQGLAIGLINEHGTQTAGYGKISESNPVPPDGRNVFEIGSITKVFTGLVLAQMVDERAVELAEPVQKLLGDSITMPKWKDREITLVDLTTHSSGLPSIPSNFKPKDVGDPYVDYTLAQMAEYLGKHRLLREPGKRYDYSNLAVGLLGHALARKNGTSYEEMVVERICKPLGMNDTRITLDDSLRSRWVQGHDFDGNPTGPWNLPTLAGAGALRSTVEDMLNFLAANMGLTKTPFDKAIADSHVVRFKLPGEGGVALGWHVQGDGVVWHNGGTGGYHSFAAFDPAKRAGVVVLANTSVSAVDALGQRLLKLLVTGNAAPLKLPKPMVVAEDALAPLAGTYQVKGGPKIVVAQSGDKLSAELPGESKMKLYAASPRRFFTRAAAELLVTFEDDVAGRPQALVIRQAGTVTKAARVDEKTKDGVSPESKSE